MAKRSIFKDEVKDARLPLDGRILSCIDYNTAMVRETLDKCHDEAVKLAKDVQLLKEDEAYDAGVYVQVHNLQNSANSVAQLVGLLEMLLEHMTADLRVIYDKRRELYQQYLLRLAEQTELIRKEERKKIERERISRKRKEQSINL